MTRFLPLAIVLFLSCPGALPAQDTILLSLEACIRMGRAQSAAALEARQEYEAAYWKYKTYRAQRLPNLSFHGEVPSISRNLVPYLHSNGSYSYVYESLARISLGASISQNIPWTGSRLFVRSDFSVDRPIGGAGRPEFMFVPLQVGLEHSFFAPNHLRWKSRIEPAEYKLAKEVFVQRLEQISSQVVSLFFNLKQREQALEIARLNLANADTLYRIAQGRFGIGKIAENDVLQIKLSHMQARQAVSQGEIDLQHARFRLQTYLGLSPEVRWALDSVGAHRVQPVEYTQALALALARSPELRSYRIATTRAEYGVALARAERGFDLSLSLSTGLSRAGHGSSPERMPLQDQQRVSVVLHVPVLDWGAGRGRVRMARSALELQKIRAAREEETFRQDLFLEIMRYNRQPELLANAEQADQIAQNRYKITHARFLVGRVDVLDLDRAQVDRDRARLSRLEAVAQSWSSYYAVRALTLFDPVSGESLDVDPESLLQK